MNSEPISLYVHIPFCATKCPYCDFNTYARIEHLFKPYLNALQHEIAQWGYLLRGPDVKTVFFGGGTPSYLPGEFIHELINAIRATFNLSKSTEITLESNPRDLTLAHSKALFQSGVNRISLGAQSFNDDILAVLGRNHDKRSIVQAYQNARNAGFININLDLIYGVPTLSADSWKQTLRDAILLEPEHLSLYCLTLEKGTPMHIAVKQGTMPKPDDDLAADQYLHAESELVRNNYLQYEISNWSKENYSCNHNLQYWKNLPYLGFGPGAHSYISGIRFSNLKSPAKYIDLSETWESHQIDRPILQHLSDNPLIIQADAISKKVSMAEHMFLGLRLNAGITDREFRMIYGQNFTEIFAEQIDHLSTSDLLCWNKNHLTLTKKGRLLANEVFLPFIHSYLNPN